jgi:hypothetical protein
MSDDTLIARIACGAAAGLVGTFALQGIREPSQKLLPETTPPIREDPGEFMVEQAEEVLPAEMREQVPGAAETMAAKSLALGYGMTAGTLYALLRPDAGDLVVDGVALGVGTWAAGYLGWMPALGLMPSITEQDTMEVAGPIVQHMLFGIVTVAIYQWLRQRV